MSGDTTTSDWGIPEYTFNPSERLWTKISQMLYKLSDANRQKKHKDKLREGLIRVHLQVQAQPSSFLVTTLKKLLRK